MFWKIALGAGILGFVVGLAALLISLRVLTTTLDETAQNVALGFFLFSVLLVIGAFLLVAVSAIFVLRASKQEFDAKKQ